MPISASALVWRPSKLISDTTPAQNGGGCDFTQTITTNVKNNVFSDVSQSERLSGSTKYRKVYLHVTSNDSLILMNAKVYIDAFTAGGDVVLISPTNKTSTQATLPSQVCGVGTLQTQAAIGATSIVLTVENPTLYAGVNPFVTDDWLYIRNGSTEDFATITGRTHNGDGTETITFSPELLNSYAADSTLVSSVVLALSVYAGATGDATVDSALGAFSIAAMTFNNKGTIDDTFTLTFTTATDYNAAGVLAGAVGSGNTSSTFAPNNVLTTTPLFSIPSNCFIGTFEAGDTVVIGTNSATIPVWVKRVVPAGTAAFINNSINIGVIAES